MSVDGPDVDALKHGLIVMQAHDDRTYQAHVLLAGHVIGMIDVVEMIRSVPVVLHDEAGLAMAQQEPDSFAFILGIAESAELKDTPRLRSIHAGVRAAQERP